VRKLATLTDHRDWTLAHINNHRRSLSGQTKDADFSRSSVNANWAAGLEDVRHSFAHRDWVQPTELGEGMRIYYLPPASIFDLGPTSPSAVKVAEIPEEAETGPGPQPRPRRSA
jgi:NTE family protein